MRETPPCEYGRMHSSACPLILLRFERVFDETREERIREVFLRVLPLPHQLLDSRIEPDGEGLRRLGKNLVRGRPLWDRACHLRTTALPRRLCRDVGVEPREVRHVLDRRSLERMRARVECFAPHVQHALLVVAVAVVPPPANVPLAPVEGAVKATVTPETTFPPASFTVACSAVADRKSTRL